MDNEIRIRVARHLAKLAEEIGMVERQVVDERATLARLTSGDNDITFNYVTSVDRLSSLQAIQKTKLDGFVAAYELAQICEAITAEETAKLQRIRYTEMGKYTHGVLLHAGGVDQVFHYPINRDQRDAINSRALELKTMVLEALTAKEQIKAIETAEENDRRAANFRQALIEQFSRHPRSALQGRLDFLRNNNVDTDKVFPGRDRIPGNELAKLCVEVELERRLHDLGKEFVLKPFEAQTAINRYLGIALPLADDVVIGLR